MVQNITGIVYCLLVGVSIVVVVFQLAGVGLRRRRLTGNLVFLGGTILCWQVCAAVMTMVPDKAASMLLLDLSFAFASFAALGVFLFTVRFYSLDSYHTAGTIAVLSVLPALTAILVFFRGVHGFMRLADGGHGVWFWVQETYSLLLLVLAGAIAVNQYIGMPRFFHNSSRILIAGVSFMLGGALLELTGVFPADGVDLSLAGASVCFVLLYMSSRYNLGLDYLVRARGEIFNELGEAIFITDSDGNIIRRNLAARYLLFSSCIEVDEPDISAVLEKIFGAGGGKQEESGRNGADYALQTGEGEGKVYNIKEKPIADRRGAVIGIMYICTDVTEDHAAIRRIETCAGLDPMTGLLNRNMLEQKMRETDERGQLPAAVIMCDLDNLKHINDTLGHNHGDMVIRMAADVLLAASPPSAYVGRLGGDEFLVIAPGMDEKHAQALAEDIYKRAGDTKNGAVRVSLSLGVAVKERADQRWHHVIDLADRRMYGDKAGNTETKDNA